MVNGPSSVTCQWVKISKALKASLPRQTEENLIHSPGKSCHLIRSKSFSLYENDILDAYNVDPSPSDVCLKHHLQKMQALLHLSPPPLPVTTPAKPLVLQRRTFPRLNIPRCSPIKGSSVVADDASTVDYSSMTS